MGMGRSEHRTFEREARELFLSFANRHGLAFEEDRESPVELALIFPAQPGLRQKVILGLQNGDELNFGVDQFWSAMFPYPEKFMEFNRILDAWMEGDARILIYRWCRGMELQLRSDERWQTVYRANGFPFRGRVIRIVHNRDEEADPRP